MHSVFLCDTTGVLIDVFNFVQFYTKIFYAMHLYECNLVIHPLSLILNKS